MRRSVGSIRDRGEGRWEVSVSAGYMRDGRRYRPSRIVRGTRRDAERELATLVAITGKLCPDKMTLESYLLDVWLPTKDGLRERTRVNYASKINACIVPRIGHILLASLDAYQVERWVSDLTRAGKSPQTVRHAHGILRNAMRAAVRWRLVDFDPTAGAPLPRVSYQPVVLSKEQMMDYRDAFRDERIEPIVLLCLFGGLRRSEACAVEWQDIDFWREGDAIHLAVTIARGLHQQGGRVWYEKPKSDTSARTIELPTHVAERLLPMRGVGPLVPVGSDPMAPEAVSRAYKAVVEEKGLPWVPLRNLRNSHGTDLYRSGASIDSVSARLGHKDSRVTRDHYVTREAMTADPVVMGILNALPVRQNPPNSRATIAPDDTKTMTG